MQRIRVLGVQAANGIYTADDRGLIQVEVSQLVDEVNRIASQAQFNTMDLFKGDFARGAKGSMWFHMGPNQFQREKVFIGTMTAQALRLIENDQPRSLSTAQKANDIIGIVDEALDKI